MSPSFSVVTTAHAEIFEGYPDAIICTAGMGRGLAREAAARYSFMLAMPAILGAGVLQLFDVLKGTETITSSPVALVAGTVTAAVVGYLCIRFLLSYLRRGTLYVFAAYCAVIGAIVVLVNLL